MAGSVGTAREAADDCVRAAIGVARSSISLFFLTGRISADHICGQIRDLARPPEVCNGQTMEGGKVAKALPRLPATQEKADEPWFGIAYASAIRGRLHLTAISVFFVYVLFAISCGAATAFNPIRERLVVSTDMTPIDIEVVWLYERKTDCPGLGAQRFGRIGQLEDTLLTKIECDEALPSSFARCQTEFPFEGFAVRLNFDRDLLPRWREVISFSANFLESKQYRPIESR
jgi:hypothetical protein